LEEGNDRLEFEEENEEVEDLSEEFK